MNKFQYNYGLWQALGIAVQAKRIERGSERALVELQNARFAKLLGYARGHSPFYERLYRKEDSGLTLSNLESLPSVTKTTVMENFDEVLTDRSVDKATVLQFAENPSNVGRSLKGQYFVARTSGTTGLVAHYVHDLFSYFLIHVLTAVRSKGVTPFSFLTKGKIAPERLRIANLDAPSADLGVASVIASAPQWVRAFVDFKLLDIFEKWEDNISSLNRFQPHILGSFPTILEQLAESQRAGTLRIHPRTVTSGGEILTSSVRKAISEAFGCEVCDCYGCSEAGWVGMECEERHGIHIFSDWVIVEPVDETNRRVPPGVECDKILLTNLANYVQPFIRFELSDRATLLEGECPCGSVLPRVLLKGRAEEVLYFSVGEGRKIAVPPVLFSTLADMVPGLHRYQVIQDDGYSLTVLFAVRSDADGAAVQSSLKCNFEEYFAKNALMPFIKLNIRQTDAIERDPGGKVRHVFSRV